MHKLEYLGYLFYAVGVYLMFTDPEATKAGMDGQSYAGDIYAFAGAGCCAIFNLLNEGEMEDLHPMVTLTQNFIFAAFFQLLIFPFVVGPSVFFSMDQTEGAFGWLVSPDAFFLLMGVVAPITGILGNLGFYSSYYYFPMEIVAGTMLIEPFFAQIVGVAMGQDEIPGIKTVFGVSVITIGFIVAGLGASYKTNAAAGIDELDALDDDKADNENNGKKDVYKRLD